MNDWSKGPTNAFVHNRGGLQAGTGKTTGSGRFPRDPRGLRRGFQMTLMMLNDAIGIYWGIMWAEGGPAIFSPLIKPSRPVLAPPGFPGQCPRPINQYLSLHPRAMLITGIGPFVGAIKVPGRVTFCTSPSFPPTPDGMITEALHVLPHEWQPVIKFFALPSFLLPSRFPQQCCVSASKSVLASYLALSMIYKLSACR